MRPLGTVALVGRPNVGKSTLLNQILGMPLSAVSNKVNTTQQQISITRNFGSSQLVYLDTPGFLTKKQGSSELRLKAMSRAITASLEDADLVLFITEGLLWNPEETEFLHTLNQALSPQRQPKLFWVINKVDKIREKSKLLAYIKTISQLNLRFCEIFPLCAKNRAHVEALEQGVLQALAIQARPPSTLLAPERSSSEEFLISEAIREQIYQTCYQELPYQTQVQVEHLAASDRGASPDTFHVSLLVKKENHRKFLIGKHGDKIGTIRTRAERKLSKLLKKRVKLHLFVKLCDTFEASLLPSNLSVSL